jgi:signal recognition particle GTPase
MDDETMFADTASTQLDTASTFVDQASIKHDNLYFYPPRAVNEYFVGRAKELKALEFDLLATKTAESQQQAVLAVIGIGGSGKTELAAKFAHDHREK